MTSRWREVTIRFKGDEHKLDPQDAGEFVESLGGDLMYRPNFLKVLILFVCFTAVPGTLFTQTSSAQEDSLGDPEPPPAGPGLPLAGPGLPLAGPETPSGAPEPPSARDGADSREELRKVRDALQAFANIVAVVVFIVLYALYTVQMFVAIRRASRPVSAKRRDGSKVSISILQAVSYFDGGLSHIWPFLILTFCLPIFLSSISDVVPVLYPSLDKIDESSHQLFVSSSGAQLVYFVSIVTISVLITLEFSYIYNLGQDVSEWRPTLLVALVLDLANLLVFNLVVRHPDQWIYSPSALIQIGMVLAAGLAFSSTFLILIFARTAAALNAGQIDFPTSDDAIDHQKGKNIGGTEEDG